MCPGVRLEGWLRCFAHPFGGVVCRVLQHPIFPHHSSEVAVGFFWSFCILLSIICPNCTCMQLFLVPYSFFVFCCLRRRLSRCKNCSKGSQVPGPSLSQNDYFPNVKAYNIAVVITMVFHWRRGDIQINGTE